MKPFPVHSITPRSFQTTVPADPEPGKSSRQRQALSPRAAWVMQLLQNYAKVDRPAVLLSTIGNQLKQQFANCKKGTLRKLVKGLTQKGLARREGDSIKLTESGEQFSAVTTASNANPSMTNVNVQSSAQSPTPQTCSAPARAASHNPALSSEATSGDFPLCYADVDPHDT